MTDLSAPQFHNPVAARAYLENLRWPDGRVCPHCGTLGGYTTKRDGVYRCADKDCRKDFSVTVGTIFERSHIPLHKWMLAFRLLCGSKKGMSAHQLHRQLDVTYKTAWFMAHRIREAMKDDGSSGKLGGGGKVVEADETFFGKVKDAPKKPQGGMAHKIAVLSLVERGGNVRSRKLTKISKAEIEGMMYRHVHPDSTLHTDGAQHYRYPMAVDDHEWVDHGKQYVRKGRKGPVHTNTLEGYFSVFKRGLVGTYQHISEQHTDRYLAEFDFRQNTRARLGIDDHERTERALRGAEGKRLTYRRGGLTGKPAKPRRKSRVLPYEEALRRVLHAKERKP